ncbi:MAG: hypothetical protein ACKO7P_08220 [Bacteroidota bacterium]
MKGIILIFGFILALILGFLFAGFFGSILFGVTLTGALLITRLKSGKKLSLMLLGFQILTFTSISYGLMYFFGLVGAEMEVQRKLSLIEEELKKSNYKTSWVMISQKRSETFNRILKNSVKDSHHMKGKAIDIYVFDIDGDGTFNKTDIEILKQVNQKVEKENPELKGAFGDYFKDESDLFSSHMIHIDTRGKSIIYSAN